MVREKLRERRKIMIRWWLLTGGEKKSESSWLTIVDTAESPWQGSDRLFLPLAEGGKSTEEMC